MRPLAGQHAAAAAEAAATTVEATQTAAAAAAATKPQSSLQILTTLAQKRPKYKTHKYTPVAGRYENVLLHARHT